MFAIALALSFMSLAHNDISWNSNSATDSSTSQESGSWVSRVTHLFGNYRPVMGRLTMAASIQTCNGATDCANVTDPDTTQVVGYTTKVEDQSDPTKWLFTTETWCEKCQATLELKQSILKKDVTDLQTTLKAINATALANLKEKASAATPVADSKKAKKDKEKLAREEKKAKRDVALCKIEEEHISDDGTEVVRGDAVDKDEVNDCLRDHYEQYVNSTEKGAKSILKGLESRLMAQYLMERFYLQAQQSRR